MTNKSLSEQICEMCGIKYELYYDFIKFEYIWLTKEEFKKYKYNKALSLTKGLEKQELEKMYPYPEIDFQHNNDNFVKLLNLMHQNDILISNIDFDNDREFSELIIEQLYLELSKHNLKEFKKDMRNTVWK